MNSQEEKTPKPFEESPVKMNSMLLISILVSGLIIAGALMYRSDVPAEDNEVASNQSDTTVSELEQKVLPVGGVVLPITWGNLGAQMIDAGVIDAEKFRYMYKQRGLLNEDLETLLSEKKTDDNIEITRENAPLLLNMFWALGLSNKNSILEEGPMMDPRYGGAHRFASTAGWTLAKGNPMDHYSRHSFFNLTPEQQELVLKVSKGIYRPCCNNSTHFPDCNHGMAMLGLLELAASQGVSEEMLWEIALVVNSYWFPDTYLTIATYKENAGVPWDKVDPKEVLGIDYSSASGYSKIASQVRTPKGQGGGCSV